MAQKTIVGLDVGSSRLRGVEALNSKNHPKIISIATVKLPEGVVVRGEVQDPIAFGEALKHLWREGKFSAKDARVILNSENHITSNEVFDDEIDFEKVLPFALSQNPNTPFKPSDYYLSFHTIDKYEEQVEDRNALEGYKTVPKRAIFLGGVEKGNVDTLLEGFALANLRVLSIDLAPLAIIRGEVDLPPAVDESEINVHVNIGSSLTTIVMEDQSQPLYVRIIGNGGNDITNSIRDQLGVSEQEAEQLKIRTISMDEKLVSRDYEAGSVFSSSSERDTTENYTINERDALAVVNNQLGAIIDNIKQTINFVITNSPTDLSNINTVFLSGGTAAFDKIRHHLVHEIHAHNTTLSKPFTALAQNKLIDPKLHAKFADSEHEYTLAVGALNSDAKEHND